MAVIPYLEALQQLAVVREPIQQQVILEDLEAVLEVVMQVAQAHLVKDMLAGHLMVKAVLEVVALEV
jgi:hypothetical protein